MYCTHHGTYSRSTTAHSQHISHHVHNSNSKTHTTSLTQPHTNHKYTQKTDGNSGQTHAQPTKPHTTHRECATHTTHSHKHAIEITHRPVCRQHETRHTDKNTHTLTEDIRHNAKPTSRRVLKIHRPTDVYPIRHTQKAYRQHSYNTVHNTTDNRKTRHISHQTGHRKPQNQHAACSNTNG